MLYSDERQLKPRTLDSLLTKLLVTEDFLNANFAESWKTYQILLDGEHPNMNYLKGHEFGFIWTLEL